MASPVGVDQNFEIHRVPLIRSRSFAEFYLGAVAVLFTAVGVWAGMKLTRRKVVVAEPDFRFKESMLQRLSISKRECQIERRKQIGVSAAELDLQIKKGEDIKRMYRNPAIRFGMTLMKILPVGVIITLISAAVLRKKRKRVYTGIASRRKNDA